MCLLVDVSHSGSVLMCTAGQGHFLPESPLGLSIMSYMESKRLAIEFKLRYKRHAWASLVAQLIQNPPAMQETPVQFLGREDLLEKGKATHSSIQAWRIPCAIQSMGFQRVGHD